MVNHIFRLRRGDDLKKEIIAYANNNRIKAAVVISGVGCVSHARVRDASGVSVKDIDEDLEIVSLNGTVSENRTHLHISFSREDLSVIGGHLKDGCIVNTTAEIVLLEMDDVEFSGEFDEETGYDELKIQNGK